MQLKFMSLMVENQDHALEFYTSVLGFKKMADIPVGPFRWLTVSSPHGVDGAELVLEPMGFPPSRAYQKAMFEAGIPAIALITKDVAGDFERLKAKGVKFRGEPASMGPITAVTFEDTCGNLVNLVQPAA
ncbi:MAG TPA: VOC family protein [Candidatus Eisenbacteria bacterium]|nr:VOC family protein [Candidatus Eisenbacteria bacterium]